MSRVAITGPMRAGKSTRMLALWHEESARRRVWITHQLHRHGAMTHGERECPINERIQSLVHWVETSGDAYDVVFIDEAQFFNATDLVDGLRALGRKTVYVGGLDLDYRRRQFAWLLVGQPWSEVTVLSGRCQVCQSGGASLTAYTGPPFSSEFAPDSDDFMTVCERCWACVQ